MFHTSDRLHNLGLFILRVGIGLIFMWHGFPKLIGGPEKWLWFGNQMSYFGITFAPVFWGFCAAASEFFGGIALVLGFYTRIAAFFIGCVMFVALVMHVSKGDAFGTFSHPLSLLIVFLSLMVMGGGAWSLRD